MAKYKHLTFKERSIIQSMLNERYKLSSIANTFEKKCKNYTHVSKQKQVSPPSQSSQRNLP